MDVIDLAVIEYAKSTSVDFNAYKRISHTPFDPSTKRTEAIIGVDAARFKAVKGAPQIVLSLCREIDKDDMAKADRMIGRAFPERIPNDSRRPFGRQRSG